MEAQMQNRQLSRTKKWFLPLTVIFALYCSCIIALANEPLTNTSGWDLFSISALNPFNFGPWHRASEIPFGSVTGPLVTEGTITVDTNPSGLSFTVDGTTYNSPQSFNWELGSAHTIGAVSPQPGDTNTRYIWSNWSDGAEQSHSII